MPWRRRGVAFVVARRTRALQRARAGAVGSSAGIRCVAVRAGRAARGATGDQGTGGRATRRARAAGGAELNRALTTNGLLYVAPSILTEKGNVTPAIPSSLLRLSSPKTPLMSAGLEAINANMVTCPMLVSLGLHVVPIRREERVGVPRRWQAVVGRITGALGVAAELDPAVAGERQGGVARAFNDERKGRVMGGRQVNSVPLGRLFPAKRNTWFRVPGSGISRRISDPKRETRSRKLKAQ